MMNIEGELQMLEIGWLQAKRGVSLGEAKLGHLRFMEKVAKGVIEQ
ncbi:hypothetical protein KAT51_00935 [bacterium]|nr:hypothetical protein [bacterium]